MWKWVSIRPPETWINSAPISIWAAATTCRVVDEPGCHWIRHNGRATISPPSTTAAQTWTWIEAASPAQV